MIFQRLAQFLERNRHLILHSILRYLKLPRNLPVFQALDLAHREDLTTLLRQGIDRPTDILVDVGQGSERRFVLFERLDVEPAPQLLTVISRSIVGLVLEEIQTSISDHRKHESIDILDLGQYIAMFPQIEEYILHDILGILPTADVGLRKTHPPHEGVLIEADKLFLMK